jgi:hypothetical protein
MLHELALPPRDRGGRCDSLHGPLLLRAVLWTGDVLMIVSQTLNINGCWDWEVEIDCDIFPAERGSREFPGAAQEVSINAIRVDGVDIMPRLPKGLVEALEKDLGDGREYTTRRYAEAA